MKPTSMKIIALIVGLAGLFLLSACAAPSTAPTESNTSEDTSLTLTSIEGETVSVADLGGEVYILNFWASWCGPCRVEMPELQKFYDAHGQGSGEYIFLSINRGEAPDQAAAYIAEFGYTFPIFLDSNDSLYNQFNLIGMPATVIIQADGTVLKSHNGVINQAFLEDLLFPFMTN